MKLSITYTQEQSADCVRRMLCVEVVSGYVCVCVCACSVLVCLDRDYVSVCFVSFIVVCLCFCCVLVRKRATGMDFFVGVYVN